MPCRVAGGLRRVVAGWRTLWGARGGVSQAVEMGLVSVWRLSYRPRSVIGRRNSTIANDRQSVEYRLLKFNRDETVPVRGRAADDTPTVFEQGSAGPLPAVLLFTNRNVGRLLASDALSAALTDRGRKHPAKGLRGLLLGRPGIPVIRGSYTDPGQLSRSVRTFLGHAATAGERKPFIIGADPEVFEELWARARSQPRVSTEGGDADSAELLDLLPTLEVPTDLNRRFVGHSRHAQLVRQLILRAARSHEPALILGATGTGKEVVARSIHDFGDRRAEPFIAVNCAGIPSDLLESELFGHERGAFTGAVHKKPGLWKVAGRGTLFLDEIGDMSKGHQAKLLRALQEGRIRPVGGTQEVVVRARVLAATNRDLFGLVRAGDFREDLYYRLRSFLIETPSLQDHPEDIPTLAGWFWKQIADGAHTVLPPRIMDALSARHWPGNARELRAVLANLQALFGEDDLDIGHLGAVLRLHGYELDTPPPRRVEARMDRWRSRESLLRLEEVLRASQATLAPLRRRKIDADDVARVGRALRHRIAELRFVASDSLDDLPASCRDELLVLRAALIDLSGDLDVDLTAARRRLRRDITPRFDEVIDCVRTRLGTPDQG